jgi:DNA-binding GntR family transcriptional regulator
MADALLVETRMCLAALQDNPPPPADLLDEHEALLAAVRDGDAERLSRVLEAHMADAVDRILAPGIATARPA